MIFIDFLKVLIEYIMTFIDFLKVLIEYTMTFIVFKSHNPIYHDFYKLYNFIKIIKNHNQISPKPQARYSLGFRLHMRWFFTESKIDLFFGDVITYC